MPFDLKKIIFQLLWLNKPNKTHEELFEGEVKHGAGPYRLWNLFPFSTTSTWTGEEDFLTNL